MFVLCLSHFSFLLFLVAALVKVGFSFPGSGEVWKEIKFNLRCSGLTQEPIHKVILSTFKMISSFVFIVEVHPL